MRQPDAISSADVPASGTSSYSSKSVESETEPSRACWSSASQNRWRRIDSSNSSSFVVAFISSVDTARRQRTAWSATRRGGSALSVARRPARSAGTLQFRTAGRSLHPLPVPSDQLHHPEPKRRDLGALAHCGIGQDAYAVDWSREEFDCAAGAGQQLRGPQVGLNAGPGDPDCLARDGSRLGKRRDGRRAGERGNEVEARHDARAHPVNRKGIGKAAGSGGAAAGIGAAWDVAVGVAASSLLRAFGEALAAGPAAKLQARQGGRCRLGCPGLTRKGASNKIIGLHRGGRKPPGEGSPNCPIWQRWIHRIK
jgi:hypothetical protein